MVDFKALLKKPPMSEEDRQKLWDDWYNGLSESERKTVDKEMRRIGEQRMSRIETRYCDVCNEEIDDFYDGDVDCVKHFIRSIESNNSYIGLEEDFCSVKCLIKCVSKRIKEDNVKLEETDGE